MWTFECLLFFLRKPTTRKGKDQPIIFPASQDPKNDCMEDKRATSLLEQTQGLCFSTVWIIGVERRNINNTWGEPQPKKSETYNKSPPPPFLFISDVGVKLPSVMI